MKVLLITIFFLLTTILVCGQIQNKKFEVGVSVLTVNYTKGSNFFGFYLGNTEPLIAILDGCFFRYSKNRFALRAQSSYTRHKKEISGFAMGTLEFNDFKLGIGAQYQLLRNTKFLYGMIDAIYNNVRWFGTIIGDTPYDQYSYLAKINGCDFFFGLGCRFKIFKALTLSPELSDDFFIGKENIISTSVISHESKNNDYRLISNHLIFKINFNYLF